ncbi:MAG: hypothetical protein WCE79_12240 [Xanthobacteraceae bacterium]
MAAGDVQGDDEHWSMVVLYDPKSGAIVHSHQVVTARGAVHPDAQAIEREALEQAAHARKASVSAAFLHVNPREIDLAAAHVVDVKTGQLKAVAKAEPGKRLR